MKLHTLSLAKLEFRIFDELEALNMSGFVRFKPSPDLKPRTKVMIRRSRFDDVLDIASCELLFMELRGSYHVHCTLTCPAPRFGKSIRWFHE